MLLVSILVREVNNSFIALPPRSPISVTYTGYGYNEHWPTTTRILCIKIIVIIHGVSGGGGGVPLFCLGRGVPLSCPGGCTPVLKPDWGTPLSGYRSALPRLQASVGWTTRSPHTHTHRLQGKDLETRGYPLPLLTDTHHWKQHLPVVLRTRAVTSWRSRRVKHPLPSPLPPPPQLQSEMNTKQPKIPPTVSWAYENTNRASSWWLIFWSTSEFLSPKIDV